jgi:hypothetical protein
MDNYSKSILTVIAFLMFGILFKDQLITSAYAAMDQEDYNMVKYGLSEIADAIKSSN